MPHNDLVAPADEDCYSFGTHNPGRRLIGEGFVVWPVYEVKFKCTRGWGKEIGWKLFLELMKEQVSRGLGDPEN